MSLGFAYTKFCSGINPEIAKASNGGWQVKCGCYDQKSKQELAEDNSLGGPISDVER